MKAILILMLLPLTMFAQSRYDSLTVEAEKAFNQSPYAITLDNKLIRINEETEKVWKMPDTLPSAGVLVATFFIVENMDARPEYNYDMSMRHVRDRQRFTMFLTGMTVSTGTFYVVKKIRNRKTLRYD